MINCNCQEQEFDKNCPEHGDIVNVPNQFGMGALPPPGSEWQMGKTAGFISVANMLMRAEAELKALDSADINLIKDIDETLKWAGVRR